MIYIETGSELKMKKILAAVTVVALCMALVGCGDASLGMKDTDESYFRYKPAKKEQGGIPSCRLSVCSRQPTASLMQ